MEGCDNLNLIDESEFGQNNAGFENPPPNQPPNSLQDEDEGFPQQPDNNPQQHDGYPPQSGNNPQQHEVFPMQPNSNPQQHDSNNKSPPCPQQRGGYTPQPSGYREPIYTQQDYPQGQYVQQQQMVVMTQPMRHSDIIGQSQPRAYMILASMCCFWPVGLCALHYISKANRLAAEGNMTEAQIASRKARNLIVTSVSIGIAIICGAIYGYLRGHSYGLF